MHVTEASLSSVDMSDWWNRYCTYLTVRGSQDYVKSGFSCVTKRTSTLSYRLSASSNLCVFLRCLLVCCQNKIKSKNGKWEQRCTVSLSVVSHVGVQI